MRTVIYLSVYLFICLSIFSKAYCVEDECSARLERKFLFLGRCGVGGFLSPALCSARLTVVRGATSQILESTRHWLGVPSVCHSSILIFRSPAPFT